MNQDPRPGLLLLEALPTLAGGQTVLLNLLPALTDRYRVSILLPGEGELAQACQAQGVACFFAPIGRYSLMHKSLRDLAAYSALTPRLVWRTLRLIRQQQIDLVYANSGPTFLWGALAAQLAGCPILWHHHNLFADGKTLFAVRTAAHLPALRTIVCASPAAQQQLAGLPPRTLTVPNGVNTERFSPNPAARPQIRSALGIPDNAWVVGLVGDLIPLKHQDTLLTALPMVRQQFPQTWAVLAGEARSGEALSQRYAQQLRQLPQTQVLQIGRRTDLPDLLNALDLLVVASERETGPLVLLEALACGLPVLSTPVGRAPELLPADLLFPVGDSAALAAALNAWLPARERRENAARQLRQLAERNLSLAHFQNALQHVIAEILSPPLPQESRLL
ncbi:MAG: glycosyltransferase [Caldilinea sp.]|jgi:glycosyltransferase involved in cell wall biosynthesis